MKYYQLSVADHPGHEDPFFEQLSNAQRSAAVCSLDGRVWSIRDRASHKVLFLYVYGVCFAPVSEEQ